MSALPRNPALGARRCGAVDAPRARPAVHRRVPGEDGLLRTIVPAPAPERPRRGY